MLNVMVLMSVVLVFWLSMLLRMLELLYDYGGLSSVDINNEDCTGWFCWQSPICVVTDRIMF